jgi:RHS repeat-associated protein
MGSAAEIARPLAVVEDVETATPLLWFVHVDHLHRPVRMTNAAKATVWTAAWLPWGGVQSITSSGGGALNLRFPGQWFQLETGLHYNWHRSYDPSLGRYTQPDPLGFVDGPSVYGYVKGSPLKASDFLGLAPDPPKLPVVIDPRTGKQVFPPETVPTQPSIEQPEVLKPSPTPGSFKCDVILATCISKCNKSPFCKIPYGIGLAYRLQCLGRCAASYRTCVIGVTLGGGG